MKTGTSARLCISSHLQIKVLKVISSQVNKLEEIIIFAVSSAYEHIYRETGDEMLKILVPIILFCIEVLNYKSWMFMFLPISSYHLYVFSFFFSFF